MNTVATAHRTVVAGSDASFTQDGHATMLAAALAAGVRLPYECASGGCGTCKARLIEGEVVSLWSEATGLSERDQRKGDRILTCQSVPVSDCVIAAVVDDDRGHVPEVRAQPARVVRLDGLNQSTQVLELAIQTDMAYLAGQFVVITFPDGTRRAYSMSRRHASGEHLEVVVRAKPGGAATAWLFETLAVGDEVMVEGPYGHAHLQSAVDRPILGVAGGSGLGPVLAVCEAAIEQSPLRPVHLYFGSRLTRDLFFHDRLRALADVGAVVHTVVEQDPDSGHERGLVGDVIVSSWADLTGFDVYMCGPKGMIDACLAQLIRTGLAQADRVFFDRFQ